MNTDNICPILLNNLPLPYVTEIKHLGNTLQSNGSMLKENANELIQALIKLKPSAAKGTYIKSIALSSTMSAGIQIDTKSVTA